MVELREAVTVTGVSMLAILAVVGLGCDRKKEGATSTEQASSSEDNKAESEESAERSGNESGEGSTESTSGSESGGRADASAADPALLDPEKADAKAPETFKVKFETTEGAFVGKFHRKWAPNGVDRFYNLVRLGYYEDVAFFRVIDGFMAQFGIHGNPKVNQAWAGETIPDDPVEKSNKRGYITFAKRQQPDSRTTQLFVNYRDNTQLDEKGFAPIGKVIEGMETVDNLYAGYGGKKVSQSKLRERGNAYLEENFPELDYIESAKLVDDP